MQDARFNTSSQCDFKILGLRRSILRLIHPSPTTLVARQNDSDMASKILARAGKDVLHGLEDGLDSELQAEFEKDQVDPSPNQIDSNGLTPVHLASCSRQGTLVKLVSHKYDLYHVFYWFTLLLLLLLFLLLLVLVLVLVLLLLRGRQVWTHCWCYWRREATHVRWMTCYAHPFMSPRPTHSTTTCVP